MNVLTKWLNPPKEEAPTRSKDLWAEWAVLVKEQLSSYLNFIKLQNEVNGKLIKVNKDMLDYVISLESRIKVLEGIDAGRIPK